MFSRVHLIFSHNYLNKNDLLGFSSYCWKGNRVTCGTKLKKRTFMVRPSCQGIHQVLCPALVCYLFDTEQYHPMCSLCNIPFYFFFFPSICKKKCRQYLHLLKGDWRSGISDYKKRQRVVTYVYVPFLLWLFFTHDVGLLL